MSALTLIPARADSPLALTLVELAAGETAPLGSDPAAHELVYVLEGEIALGGDGALAGDVAGREPLAVAAESAFLCDGADGPAVVAGGAGGARLAVFAAGPGCDVHALLGERGAPAALDLSDAGSATGRRSFQVLLGPENGCCRATMFLGVVPPGAAPWHFHQYDEIVLIVRGCGAYHEADSDTPTSPGTAVRISPRTVHINENTSDEDMHVLGVFTPAGSPAAAYLADDPRGARG